MKSAAVLLVLLLFPLSSYAVNLCDFSQRPSVNQVPSIPASSPNFKDWQLIWSDEFNHAGQPDPNKWEPQIGENKWGNDEEQFYTDRLKNARVENGHLIIEAHKEKLGQQEYTSARLHSKQTWTYGRFEIRARLPHGRGTWPALWMIAEKKVYGEGYWPDNGELDLMEEVGHEPNQIHASSHSKDHNFQDLTQQTAILDVPDANSAYHTYAIEWYPDHIDFFVDNQKYLTNSEGVENYRDWKKWPFNKDFKIILNLAVGGFWAGEQGIDASQFPAQLEISSVRVYQPAREEMCAVRR